MVRRLAPGHDPLRGKEGGGGGRVSRGGPTSPMGWSPKILNLKGAWVPIGPARLEATVARPNSAHACGAGSSPAQTRQELHTNACTSSPNRPGNSAIRITTQCGNLTTHPQFQRQPRPRDLCLSQAFKSANNQTPKLQSSMLKQCDPVLQRSGSGCRKSFSHCSYFR